MKYLLVFLFPIYVNAQSCPPGKSWMPSISNNQVVIIADTCLADSTVKNLWNDYFRSLCYVDSSITIYYTNYAIIEYNVYDSSGCNHKITYANKINGQWIEISKCLFYWMNKTRLICYGGKDKDIVIPCCGHFHKTKPLK